MKCWYRIKLNNFEKYNPNIKKGHKAVLISVGFLSDPKIMMLTPATKLLFLSCVLVAGESTSSQIEVSHESLQVQSKVKSGSLKSQLDLLQSLQLLSYEKIDILNELKLNEVKLSEMKLNELNGSEAKKSEPKNKKQSLQIVRSVPTKVSKAAVCGCIEEFSGDPIVSEMMEQVKQESQRLWVDTYKNISWIIFELKKAKGWIVDNPDRAPKSRQGMFYSKWLSRGFESYRKTVSRGQNQQPRGNWVEEHNRKVMQSLDEMDSQERVVKSES